MLRMKPRKAQGRDFSLASSINIFRFSVLPLPLQPLPSPRTELCQIRVINKYNHFPLSTGGGGMSPPSLGLLPK